MARSARTEEIDHDHRDEPQRPRALIFWRHRLAPRVLGTSRLGRAIELVEHPLPARRLLIFGGIHGDEPSSVEAVVQLGERLARHRPAAAASGEGRLWLLPSLNPDGIAAGTKNAASDVDLNRNFPARNFTPEHPPGYRPGPVPLSEPETAALARLIDDERVDAVVAVHAPFACVNYDGPAADWARAVSSACGWPVRESIGYPTPGSLGSWLGLDRGIPILTLELPPGPLAPFRAAAAAALDRAVAFWAPSR